MFQRTYNACIFWNSAWCKEASEGVGTRPIFSHVSESLA